MRCAAALVRTVTLLQQRLRAAEQARDRTAEQLFSAMRAADAQQQDVRAAQDLKKGFEDMRRRCDMALELLGERNERIEQLEEDIRDMRQIFHAQLEVR